MSWHHKDLIAKAKHFSSLASAQADHAHAALLNAFAVELLCRACLSQISPYLLASSKDRLNGAVYAKTGKLVDDFARSLETWMVLDQCERLIPNFSAIAPKCRKVIGARNADVHSGERPWTNNILWVDAYLAIDACLKLLGESPNDYFGAHASAAKEILDGYNERIGEAWASLQGQAKGRLSALSEVEIERRHQAVLNTTPTEGVMLKECPVCKRKGFMHFKIRRLAPLFDAATGNVIETGHRVPVLFMCDICGLRVPGPRLLCEAGLGEPEYFEAPIPAIDALTDKQALEQIGERFSWRSLVAAEDLELYEMGVAEFNRFEDALDDHFHRHGDE